MVFTRAHTTTGGIEVSASRTCPLAHVLAPGLRSASSPCTVGGPRVHLDHKARCVTVRYRQGDEAGAVPSSQPVPSLSEHPTTSAAPVTPAASRPGSPNTTARAQLKVIGLGLRGISAVNRLIASQSLSEAEFWALDSDKRVLATADASTRVLEVGPGDEASLGPAELAALAGGVLAPAAPELPDGHAGAVFVLGSAFGSPGGAPMLLQLVRHLRRQGYFVAAALTRPFEFEGARRLEAADSLISIMEEVAHLVVVIAQGVLTRASAELTMGQAEAIADNTLVYTVQSTLWALRAPEVLKVSHGAFLWHGRDLRNIRRPLFPPMMNLLSCPGHATLGRGQAALPLPLLQQAGLASALSTLAEDAVKAASESPFLDNKLESATGVLCVLRVPPSALGVGSGGSARPGGAGSGSNVGSGGPLVADNHKEYALRSAVQVAAMTVRDLVGPHCHDIIVCPQLCHDLEDQQQQQPGPEAGVATGGGPAPGDGAEVAAAGRTEGPVLGNAVAAAAAGAEQQRQQAPLVRVEVSLLVLERIEEAAEPKTIAGTRAPADGAASSTAAAVAAAAAGYAAAPPAALTAATARDRMTSVIGPRNPSGAKQQRRLPVPGAPTLAASYFSGQMPPQQQQQPQPQYPQSQPQQPAPSAPLGAVGPSAGQVQGTAANAAAAAAPAPAAADAAAAAAAAAAAEANRARKQARLAAMSAMSALAGGTASGAGIAGGGLQGGLLGAQGGQAGGVGTARNPGHGTAVPGQAWGPGQVSARGHPQSQAPQYAQAAAQQQPQNPYYGQQQQQQEADAPAHSGGGSGGGMFSFQQIPRMAESLVTSLVAQSLDLPPQAARWRHQQRAPPAHARGSGPGVFQLPQVDGDIHEVEDSWLDESGGGQGEGLGRGLQQLIMGMRLPGLGADGGGPASAAAGPAAVRNRVAGMLDLERKELWESPGGV